jgi:SAM-dependent methyltransferase
MERGRAWGRKYTSAGFIDPAPATLFVWTLADVVAGGGDDHALYGDLAPVYDLVLARRFDHDAMAEFVVARVPSDPTVHVAACGPGRLLARLVERAPLAVGSDRSRAMLALAADRTAAPLVRADLRAAFAERAFDAVTVLGNSLGSLAADGVERTLAAAYRSLAPGGAFCCDFTVPATLVNGTVTEDAFEDDRFRVERRVVTRLGGETALGTVGRHEYEFRVTDRDQETSARVETETRVRTFDPPALLGAALRAGFGDASLCDPPTPHRGGLVARRRPE